MNNKIIDAMRLTWNFGIIQLLKYLQAKPMYMREDEEASKNINDLLNDKIVIYTAIFGNIDKLEEPLYINEYIDYIVITDLEVPSYSKWKKYKRTDIYEYISVFNNQKKNRYCKLFPNVLFPEYKYSIYIDGQIKVCGDITQYVNQMKPCSIGMFGHPFRNDIYMEAMAVVKLRNASPKAVKRQIEYYKREGFPEKFGLFENGLIVREHNNEECITIMLEWWKQLNEFTLRDQLSFMYALWKKGYDECFVKTLGINMRNSSNIELCGHKGAKNE